MQSLIKLCKNYVKSDYARFHMFVECYDDNAWEEFIGDMTAVDTFDMINSVASHWEEMQSTAF